MSTSLLPVLGRNDPQKFKSTLDGTYKLRVVQAVDISKPKAKPTDEIDEPENEDEANEIQLNKNNARMLQLCLADTNSTQVNAIEVEKIEMLNSIQPKWTICIEGPVEFRCGNIMLEKRHVTCIEPPVPGEDPPIPQPQLHPVTRDDPPEPSPTPISIIDLDEDSEPAIIDHVDPKAEKIVPVVHGGRDAPLAVEDWDEADEEDDDCIIID